MRTLMEQNDCNDQYTLIKQSYIYFALNREHFILIMKITNLSCFSISSKSMIKYL